MSKIPTRNKENAQKKAISNEDLHRANRINQGICPVCGTHCGYPDRAAMCCEGENR